MPKWLDSMDRDDGVPAWLEPLKTARNKIANTHGALKELEKWVPTAGLAMIQVFFPSSPHFRADRIRDNVHKKFWKRAYYTKSIRRRAEQKRRQLERTRKVTQDKFKSIIIDEVKV